MRKMTMGSLVTTFRVCVAMVSVLVACVAQAAPLVKIENCTLIPTDWADGDSFQVQIPEKPAGKDGPGHKARKVTFRLYGADCIETSTKHPTDRRRVRAQRRYFGISKVGTPQASMALALKYGGMATLKTRALLAKPFTIHTAFANARGNPQFKRYYAFVVTAEGQDLASVLVSKGLARAFGVNRETFDGLSARDYEAQLTDLELQAAKNGVGVWKHTDWEKLPGERRAQREDDVEDNLGNGKVPMKPGEKLHINKASRDELMRLSGVGEVTANKIIEGRPYRKPEDLTKVNGISANTLKKLKPHLIFPAE